MTGAFTHSVITQDPSDPYQWTFAIYAGSPVRVWCRGRHSGTIEGAQQAVADALQRGANNLGADARAASLVSRDARVYN